MTLDCNPRLIESDQAVNCFAAKKRIKICAQTESEPIESFGWGDFPLILQPDISSELSHESPDILSSSSVAPQHPKRKEHPTLCEQDFDDTVLTTFGWEDFPCIEDGDNVGAFNKGVQTPFTSEINPSCPHVVEASDDCFSNSNGTSVRTCSSASRVDFAETVEIREYALTVGDHPYSPSFALSLDWAHAPAVRVALRDRSCHSGRPRRLSVWERRKRLEIAHGSATATTVAS